MKGVRVPGGVWLSVGGEAVFLPDAEEAGAAGASGVRIAGAPVSPMPGRVVKILVQAGRKVKAGDPLVAVEAMKMEYLVRAPSDGMVKALRCREGEAVAQGQALVDWEGA